jgi:hypothetical protein
VKLGGGERVGGQEADARDPAEAPLLDLDELLNVRAGQSVAVEAVEDLPVNSRSIRT